MKKTASFMVSATVILLALLLPYPSAAETMFVPRTTTTQPTTTTTSPTVVQQPATIIRPQVGNGLISVRDSYGNPVSAATISITGNGQTVIQLTSAQGDASFSNLGVGQYSYIVQKEGYCFQNIPLSLNISTGTTTTSKYVLTKFGSARVNVINNKGFAMKDAIVSVTVSGKVQSAMTDAGGMAFFGNLPTGSYLFTARKVGYRENQATANVACEKQANATIVIP